MPGRRQWHEHVSHTAPHSPPPPSLLRKAGLYLILLGFLVVGGWYALTTWVVEFRLLDDWEKHRAAKQLPGHLNSHATNVADLVGGYGFSYDQSIYVYAPDRGPGAGYRILRFALPLQARRYVFERTKNQPPSTPLLRNGGFVLERQADPPESAGKPGKPYQDEWDEVEAAFKRF